MQEYDFQSRFSSDRTLLASASPSGGVRVTDAATGRSSLQLEGGLAPEHSSTAGSSDLPGELRERIKCVWWFQTAVGPPGPSAGTVNTKLLVVGTADGSLAAVDAATAEVRWRVPNCHSESVAAVTGCIPASGPPLLLSAGADLQAVQLDPRTGKIHACFKAGKGALTCAALSHDGSKLLVGGSNLALWSVQEQKRQLKFSGHSARVQAMAFSPDDKYAISAAHAERHIVAWHTGAPASKKRQQQAGLISLQTPVTALVTHRAAADTQLPADDGSASQDFQVAALSTDGAALVWSCTLAKEGGLTATLQAVISIDPTPGSKHARILAVAFAAEHDLLVAHGASLRPSFEHAALPSPVVTKDKNHSKIVLQPSQEGALLSPAATTAAPHRTTAGKALADAAIIAPQATENLGLAVPLTLSKPPKRRREDGSESGLDSPKGAALENGALPNGLHAADDELGDMDTDEVADGQPTLGEQLAAMGIEPREEAPEEEPEEQALLPDGPPSLQADSLVTLLTQALHSQDRQLLERCLAVGDTSVVNKTIRGLAPADAGQLLTAAVQRLQSKPSRGQQLSAWLRPLLLHHAGYLMASPGAQAALAGLYQTIEARLAMQRPLASLAGRLDLLCAQMPAAKAAQAKAQQLPFGGPQVVLHDDVPVEDAMAPDAYDSDEDDLDDDEADDSELSDD